MTTFYDDDIADDQDQDEDLEAAEDQDEDLVGDLAALADEYSAADPRERRAIWSGLDADERAALRTMGISGPVAAEPDEDFEPVAPGEAGYASIVTQSASIVHAGLRQIGTGDLDVTPELAEEVASLLERADRFTDEVPARGRLLQQASHLIEQAKRASIDSIPFNEDDIIQRESHGMQADGRYLTVETDRRHRKREIWMTPAELEEAEAAMGEEESGRPLDLPHPDDVTIEEVASWDQRKYRAWAAEYPEAEERLAQAASVYMMTDR